MKSYKIIRRSTWWSTNRLLKSVEKALHNSSKDGWNIESIAFGTDLLMLPNAFITLSKIEDQQ